MISKQRGAFRPSFAGTVVLFLLAAFFVNLGMWQSRRGGEKLELENQFQTAEFLPLATALALDNRFARIEVTGHYENKRHILLDNQVWHGRAGVHVFSAFTTLEGDTILVNRGWLPLNAERNSLPEIPTPEELSTVEGILNIAPQPGRILGPADKLSADQWPQLVTYLNIADISKALDTPMPERVLQLSASAPAGFEGRDWKPVFLSSDRHKAYAFQWYALALTSIVLWAFGGYRKTTDKNQWQ